MATSATKTCIHCSRDTSSTSRGMCGNCYRIWQRDNFPPNATCEVCERKYFRRSSAPSGGRTCSRACFANWKRGRDQHNRPTDGATQIERACEECDAAFITLKRQVEKGGGRYCSLQCSANSKAVPRLVNVCERCTTSFEMLPNRVFFAAGRFCSRACFEAAKRSNKLPREPERGRAYRRFRTAYVADHGECERCGERGDLLLHHRQRTRERPDLLLDLGNLEVLCRSCHIRHHNEMGHFDLDAVGQ